MTNSSFKAALDRLERGPEEPRITYGSSADVQIQPPADLRALQTIPVIKELSRRGVPLPVAKTSIEALMRTPAYPVSVHVPHVESRETFGRVMAMSGVEVVFLEPVTARSDR